MKKAFMLWLVTATLMLIQKCQKQAKSLWDIDYVTRNELLVWTDTKKTVQLQASAAVKTCIFKMLMYLTEQHLCFYCIGWCF